MPASALSLSAPSLAQPSMRLDCSGKRVSRACKLVRSEKTAVSLASLAEAEDMFNMFRGMNFWYDLLLDGSGSQQIDACTYLCIHTYTYDMCMYLCEEVSKQVSK